MPFCAKTNWNSLSLICLRNFWRIRSSRSGSSSTTSILTGSIIEVTTASFDILVFQLARLKELCSEHLRFQLLEIERLGEVLRGAVRHGSLEILLVAVGGNHTHSQVR